MAPCHQLRGNRNMGSHRHEYRDVRSISLGVPGWGGSARPPGPPEAATSPCLGAQHDPGVLQGSGAGETSGCRWCWGHAGGKLVPGQHWGHARGDICPWSVPGTCQRGHQSIPSLPERAERELTKDDRMMDSSSGHTERFCGAEDGDRDRMEGQPGWGTGDRADFDGEPHVCPPVPG